MDYKHTLQKQFPPDALPQPQKSLTMLEKEVQFGKPLEILLVDLYDQHRDLGRVATQVGISRNTLWLWMRLLGLTFKHLRIAVLKRDQERKGCDPLLGESP